MQNTLLEIVAHKKLEIKRRQQRRNTLCKSSPGTTAPRDFHNALHKAGINIIAEIKPRSPAAGILRHHLDVDDILAAYNQYASAISVLTDKKYFGGSLAMLRWVKDSSPHPVLCKDFVLDASQVLEARAAGADAVLLIVKILDDQLLAGLYALTVSLGMTAVVEIQNKTELQRALKLNPEVLLINNRNLDTLEIDLTTTTKLAPIIPAHITVIAASGISKAEDVDYLLPYCHNFLVGSSLMSADNLPGKLQELCKK